MSKDALWQEASRRIDYCFDKGYVDYVTDLFRALRSRGYEYSYGYLRNVANGPCVAGVTSDSLQATVDALEDFIQSKETPKRIQFKEGAEEVLLARKQCSTNSLEEAIATIISHGYQVTISG